jgi:hypothetical protein
MPPPKPARTFEHDIYVETKRRTLNLAEIYEETAYSYDSHVYESVASPKEGVDVSPVIKLSTEKAVCLPPTCSQSLVRGADLNASFNQVN